MEEKKKPLERLVSPKKKKGRKKNILIKLDRSRRPRVADSYK